MNENWSKVLEITEEDNILKYAKEKFDENNIKYKIELEEKWEGHIRTPEYIGKFFVYVQEKFESEAKKILNQYYENDELIIEQFDKTQEVEGTKEDEKESLNVAKKQKKAIKIDVGIVICMVIILIVEGLVA